MSITFSSLVTRLTTAVPSDGGVPTSDQYAQSIRDAVADFNEAATRLKVSTLSITNGVATYTLPADFVKMVSLKGLTLSSPNLLITSAGLVPLTGPLREAVSIEGAELRITPTPVYTLDRELWYGAGHIETGTAGSTVYAEMSEREARIIMLLAQSYAYGYQAVVKVGTVTEYTVGDVRAKLGNAAVDLQGSASALLAEYKDAVKKYIGTLIARG
jgi:hypothetical protein